MVSATLSLLNTVVPGRPMSRSIDTVCATWRSRLWMPMSASTRRSRIRIASMPADYRGRRVRSAPMRDDGLLQRSQELLVKLFRNSPAAVGLVRLSDGVMLDINEAYEQLFGWSRKEVIGQSTEALRIWA